MSTKAFIEGLELLARYATNGLDGMMLHAEHEEIMLCDVPLELPEDEMQFLDDRGFRVNKEFDCWSYYASM